MRTLAFRLYLLFIASWFLHTARRVEALGPLRIDLLLVLGIGTLLFLTRDQAPVQRGGRIRKIVFFIAVYSVVTLPFVEWPGSVLNAGLPDFVKAFVFYYFTAELVTDDRRLRSLMVVFIGCQAFRVLEPVYLHVTQGYWGSFAMMADWETIDRLAGAPSDIINPNGLAFVILTVLPFFHYLGPMTRLGGLLYLGFLPAALYALVLTASRSGMLGLGITAVLIWWNSRRKVLLAATLSVIVILSLPLLSGNLQDRYASIFNSNTKNAGTAEGRWTGVESDWRVAMRRPFFGHGLGTSGEANAHYNTRPEISHNLYTETAQELGLIGLAVVVYLLITIARTFHQALKTFRQTGVRDGIVYRMSLAVQVWFGMNVLFSIASFGLSSYEWYFLAGLSEVIYHAARRAIPSTEGKPSPVSAVVVRPAALANRPGPGIYAPAGARAAIRRTAGRL